MGPMDTLRQAVDRRTALVALLAAAAGGARSRPMQPDDDPAASAIWQKIHASVFEGRRIDPAPPGALLLEAPLRAIDAAVVPVAIRSRFSGPPVKRIALVIDANPSPLGAFFGFTADSGRAEVETRIRVDAYSHVRAIAETADGHLYMTTRFVKASGGCSAPAGADAALARANLGKMNLRVEDAVVAESPARVQLAISHPNHSGLAMDQYTRQFTPSHFVRLVEVRDGGRPVFSADVDIAISENPNFRFWFLPHGSGGELQARVTDSRDMHFEATQRYGDRVL